MGQRADVLADRIELGASELANYVEELSHEEWNTVVPNEQRTVGTLVHHVASVYPVEVDLAAVLAGGQAIEEVTWDAIDAMNAEHNDANASVDQQKTIQLLRENSKVAAERVRQFSNEQLDRAAPVSLNDNAPLTTQFFIEDHALRHSFHHLGSIKSALAE